MWPCPSAGLIRAFESRGYEVPNDSAVTSIGSYEDQQPSIHIGSGATRAELPESSDAVAVLTSQLITPFSGFNHRSIRCRAPSSPPADNRSFRYPWITCCVLACKVPPVPPSNLSRDQADEAKFNHLLETAERKVKPPRTCAKSTLSQSVDSAGCVAISYPALPSICAATGAGTAVVDRTVFYD
jgi:hypothetical protein